ncbi:MULTISPECIES: MBL fold metallo-hydrolase [unclassified Mesorhizobium]|uniref:MBL fold metallo-hydrolase n=1 Tax=unclassified Mesorhizobium TaxID=325217 RepID=UPI000BAEB18A|nr:MULTISPECIES: MBL fold metallo-hydrolase [unclassified Mesorhizobium]PBB27461.1 MBL fold metallo-hydrolase [Mesorhizobium sp. WSM4304]PBB77063.1 MBL fold metallo-hydrolase [Mesorhizobium sp. WSM4308]
MIVTFRGDNVLACTAGAWRVWSLSDGYIEMPPDLLRDSQNKPVPQVAQAGTLRLSVNCFALAGPGVDGILIDSGGGGWAPTTGRLEQTLTESGIDPASITVLALTHAHQDHVYGLLTRDNRMLFPNLKAIAIAEEAMKSFLAETRLARFRSLLKPVRDGDQVVERLRAVALPGHAPGHTGYAFDTNEDSFLFFGDIVHVPVLQFGNPALSWGYDDDQSTARATRQKVFHDAAEAGTWIAGAHLGWPGIGLVVRKGEAYGYEPA